jgi:hypothetical protein
MRSDGMYSLLAVVVLAVPAAMAGGKMCPLATCKVLPKVPSERAIVVFRDGQERLVIEPSLVVCAGVWLAVYVRLPKIEVLANAQWRWHEK